MNNEEMHEDNEVTRVYISLMNLLRIKATESKGNNERIKKFIEDVEAYYRKGGNIGLLKYLYCYLYDNFDLVDGEADISFVADNKVSVIKAQEDDESKLFDIDLISCTDDKDLPIKRESFSIDVSKKKKRALLSKKIFYCTDADMEMILLEGGEKTISPDLVQSLFEEAKKVECDTASFRDFTDPLFITEIKIGDKPTVKYYEGNLERINSMEKTIETTADEYKSNSYFSYRTFRNKLVHNQLHYSTFTINELLPYMYTHLSKSDEKNYEPIDYERLDIDLLEFLSNENISDFTDSYEDIMSIIEKNRTKKNKGSK